MVLQTLTSVLRDPPFQQHLLCFSLKFLELVTCTCHHYYFSLKALHQASNTDPRSKGTSSQPDQYLFTASQPFVFPLHLTQSICSFLFRLLRSCFPASLVLLSRPLSPPTPRQRPTMVVSPKRRLLLFSLYTHLLTRCFHFRCMDHHLIHDFQTYESSQRPYMLQSQTTPSPHQRVYTESTRCRRQTLPLPPPQPWRLNVSHLWIYMAYQLYHFLSHHRTSPMIWTPTFYYLNFALTFSFHVLSLQ